MCEIKKLHFTDCCRISKLIGLVSVRRETARRITPSRGREKVLKETHESNQVSVMGNRNVNRASW